jgi:hypothetical protein
VRTQRALLPRGRSRAGLAAASQAIRGAVLRHAGPIIALLVLSLHTQWGIWHGLDLPQWDEAVAMRTGMLISRGQPYPSFAGWNQPLYPLTYALVSAITGSAHAAFITIRLALSCLSVLLMYGLLARALPRLAAFAAAAWFVVSLQLVSLNLDRSDFLAACCCTWAALGVARLNRPPRMLLALGLAFVAALYRVEYSLLVVTLAAAWAAGPLYRRLPGSAARKLSLLAAMYSAAAILGAALAIQLVARVPQVDNYFIFVFANNRNQLTRAPGIWSPLEADYGPARSIRSLLAHPRQLLRDVALNAREIQRYPRLLALQTTWFTFSVSAARWWLAVGLLVAAAGLRLWRNWPGKWRAYLKARREPLAWLLCILSISPSLLIFWPFPVYLLVLSPLILGSLVWLLYVLVRDNAPRTGPHYLAATLVVVLLAPSAYGSRYLPRLDMATYLSASPVPSPVRVAGHVAPTLCSYLAALGRQCQSSWWVEGYQAPSFEQLLQMGPHDYLIFHPFMNDLAEHDAGWQRVLAHEDPDWQEVAQFGPYRVFRFSGTPSPG